MKNEHPRDKFITVYGKNPVLEVLNDKSIKVAKCFTTMKSSNPYLKGVKKMCIQRNIELEFVDKSRIAKIAKNEKQNQGIAADVISFQKMSEEKFFSNLDQNKKQYVVVFDGVTTPANIGLIIRTATGLGAAGIFLPRKGSPKISPLIIKASAGTIFSAPIISCATPFAAVKALKANGFKCLGMDGSGSAQIDQMKLPDKAAIILGNESIGISKDVTKELDEMVSIPTSVESLNVACAATIACWEVSKNIQ